MNPTPKTLREVWADAEKEHSYESQWTRKDGTVKMLDEWATDAGDMRDPDNPAVFTYTGTQILRGDSVLFSLVSAETRSR